MTVELTTRSIIDERTQMRDAVIDRLYDLNDRDIMFLTADQGAKALDRWRANRENQYRDFGIAEQALASIGAGMAKEGKRVFIYAIAPFITTRIHEFHKLNAGVQNIPYNTLGVGSGFSYEESGPTHHNTDDIAIMRAVPNMEILNPSDSVMAAALGEYACYSNTPTYLRLDRNVLPILSDESESVEEGFKELARGNETCIISTGNMVHSALEVQQRLGRNVGVIDIYRLKPLNIKGLINSLKNYEKIVTLEEHLLAGGLGSIISEMITDNGLPVKLQRIGIDDKHVYFYGRKNIQRELGIDADSVVNNILKS